MTNGTTKNKNRKARYEFLRAKASKNKQEIDELARLAAKLEISGGGRRRGGARSIIPRQTNPDVARIARQTAEQVLERRIVGGPGNYGMPRVSPETRPGSIDTRLLGSSPEGRAWALEACHPCGEWQGAGMPDTFTSNICVFQHKSETNIFFDANLFNSAPSGVSPTWSVHILFPPIPEIAMIYRIRHDKTNTWSRWVMVRYPTCHASDDLKTANTLYDAGYSDHRITSKGETIELNAPELNNMGRIIVGQRMIAFSEDELTPVLVSSGTPSAVPETMKSLQLQYCPDENILTQISTSPYQEEAKTGAYIVHKFGNPLMGYRFHETDQAKFGNLGSAYSLPITAVFMTPSPAATGEEQGDPWAKGSYYAFDHGLPSNFYQTDTAYGFGTSNMCDMTTAEVFILSIAGGDPTTTSGAVPQGAATVRIKTRTGVEAHPAVVSPTSVFARAPPLWDQEAINAVVRVQQCQPDAYPASFNSFGSVMGSIFSWLKKWVQPAVKVIKSIPNPYTTVIGEVVDAGIDVGNGAFNGGDLT